MIVKKIFLEFCAGLILSVMGFLLFAVIYNALEILKVNINFWGDKGKVLFGLFFGLPLGSILGILLSEKLIYKTQGWNIPGIVLAVLLSVLSNYLGIIMLEKVGGGFVIFVPLLVVVICLLGYNFGLFFNLN
jgi:hypothetical protein